MKNAHLWKRILNEGFDGLNEEHENDLGKLILVSPIIVDSRPSSASEPIPYSDGLAFPFAAFWIEGIGDNDLAWGAMVETERTETGTECHMSSLIAIQSCRPQWMGSSSFRTDLNGNMLREEATIRIRKDAEARIGTENMCDHTDFIRQLACDSLSLLGCKNVSLSARENDPKQVRRAIKRHGNQSHGYRYHVLVVRPAGARSDAPSVEIGAMPRHVCRGHFAEYGPEFNKGLLFGKHAGRFFIPPHLKGKAENGIVEKDYALAP
jgi:hypothetical protein